MKSYKISQTIEKNLYPIEKKLDEIRISNHKYFRQFLDVYAPVFISALLTVAFSDKILQSGVKEVTRSAEKAPETLSAWEQFITSTLGKVIALAVIFIVFAVIVYLICLLIHAINRNRDNKGNLFKRNVLAEEFYKMLIPEIITGASLFERAYEIEIKDAEKDASEITLNEPDENTIISNKAILYYYEAFYHFRVVCDGLHGIFEYKESKRDNLKKLYTSIGIDALKQAVDLCCHCVKQINTRIEETNEDDVLSDFEDFKRTLADDIIRK